MNTTRLLKLAAFLDALPREKFDFGKIAHEGGKPMLEALEAGEERCGTVACAVGWMPACFPRSFKWKPDPSNPLFEVDGTALKVALRNAPRVTNFLAAGEWFGIAPDQADALFLPDTSGFGLRAIGRGARPGTVAKRIRQFIRLEGSRTE